MASNAQMWNRVEVRGEGFALDVMRNGGYVARVCGPDVDGRYSASVLTDEFMAYRNVGMRKSFGAALELAVRHSFEA